jgi:hypothetical protein
VSKKYFGPSIYLNDIYSSDGTLINQPESVSIAAGTINLIDVFTNIFIMKSMFVSTPFLGAVVCKGTSECGGVVDVLLNCGEVRA